MSRKLDWNSKMNNKSASLLFLGDISLHGWTGDEAVSLSNVFSAFKEKKIFANLESVFEGKTTTPKTHKIVLSSGEASAGHLSGMTGVSLSNNHIEDLGIHSVYHTMELLEKSGIKYGGYGNTIGEARRPMIIDISGIKIHFLFYSCLSTNGENYATTTDPGVCPIHLSYIKEDVAQAKLHGAGAIVVSLHWGNENDMMPNADQVYLARKIIDAGADIVWGHHTHSIQPVEFYNGKIIAYSLGNFLFKDLPNETGGGALKQSALNKESLGLCVKLDLGTKKYSV
jgi:poly-gamma-glutamate capsule biosynthesis protein CapA/YwtB (metallophosphatase superfamily)